MPLRIRPEADDEAEAAMMSRSTVAKALEFDRAHRAAVARVRADPTALPLHPEATGPAVRYAKLAGFPYIVLFRTADPAETVALAVLHTAAGPTQYRRAEPRA